MARWLKDAFRLKTPGPDSGGSFPTQSYAETVSRPNAAIRVERLHLTRAQFEGLCIKNPVHIPGIPHPR